MINLAWPDSIIFIDVLQAVHSEITVGNPGESRVKRLVFRLFNEKVAC